jgi:bacteriocin biosynthesis cyclodehydratase domain-containing protein
VSNPLLARRPRLAYPFTVLTGPNTVRLVAGEDYRYTLSGPDLDRWLPSLLERCQGKETVTCLLALLESAQREAALQVIGQLYGERVFVDGAAADAHAARTYHVVIDGRGELREQMAALLPSPSERGAGGEGRATQPPQGTPSPPTPLPGGEGGILLFCQDRLDYEEALSQQRRCRENRMPLLWASTGALSRAYVGPLFLPDAGPCFGCLFGAFQRLSPAPEIYDALRDHARQGKPIEPTEFPREGLLILQGLILWKLQEAERDDPSPGLYRLHVLERERFEVSTHRVFADPHCPLCGKERP